MVDLLCCETELEYENRAYLDPVLLNDDRVLQNLFLSEEKWTQQYHSYFAGTRDAQKEITASMRKIVAEWMLEICENERCTDEVFPTAMVYMDRFLSVSRIRKSQLQLLGAVCLFISSKMKEPRSVSAEKLVMFTDYSIDLRDLLDWELLVLSKLKWDMSVITPNDFVEQILRRLPLEPTVDLQKVRHHTTTFISLFATDHKFSMHPPSMIAAASIGAAIQGMRQSVGNSSQTLTVLLDRLHVITSIESDCLRNCLEQIEALVAETVSNNAASSSSHSAADKLGEHKAQTPTDVRDIHF